MRLSIDKINIHHFYKDFLLSQNMSVIFILQL